MTTEPLRKFTIHAEDGGVYAVDAVDQGTVATLMVISLINGRLVEDATGKFVGIDMIPVSNPLPPAQQDLWRSVRTQSWGMLHAVCLSAQTVARPVSGSPGEDSQYRLAMTANEAERRVRSQRFELLADASAN